MKFLIMKKRKQFRDQLWVTLRNSYISPMDDCVSYGIHDLLRFNLHGYLMDHVWYEVGYLTLESITEHEET